MSGEHLVEPDAPGPPRPVPGESGIWWGSGPVAYINILNRAYRVSRFKIGDQVKRVIATNDPSIDDMGHIGDVVKFFYGDSNMLQIKWRLPNIARWISRAYGDGKYLIAEMVNPFHVTPLKRTRGLPDFVDSD